jgi:hypothetical protein
MQDERSEFVSDLLDVSDLRSGIDSLGDHEVMASLARLIRETRSGQSEYSGFQNYLPVPRDGDE